MILNSKLSVNTQFTTEETELNRRKIHWTSTSATNWGKSDLVIEKKMVCLMAFLALFYK